MMQLSPHLMMVFRWYQYEVRPGERPYPPTDPNESRVLPIAPEARPIVSIADPRHPTPGVGPYGRASPVHP